MPLPTPQGSGWSSILNPNAHLNYIRTTCTVHVLYVQMLSDVNQWWSCCNLISTGLGADHWTSVLLWKINLVYSLVSTPSSSSYKLQVPLCTETLIYYLTSPSLFQLNSDTYEMRRPPLKQKERKIKLKIITKKGNFLRRLRQLQVFPATIMLISLLSIAWDFVSKRFYECFSYFIVYFKPGRSYHLCSQVDFSFRARWAWEEAIARNRKVNQPTASTVRVTARADGRHRLTLQLIMKLQKTQMG